MASLERPRLRWLRGRRIDHQGHSYVGFDDPFRVADPSVLVPLDVAQYVLPHFDGQNSLPEIQARILRATGQLIAGGDLASLVAQLDRAMILDGPAFAAFRESYAQQRVRPAAFAGNSYAGTEKALRAQLGQFFAHADGSGAADGPPVSGAANGSRLRGILSPHIDFHRGGPVYTWSYKELVERSDADVFVILGVAHQPCEHRFVLTRKDFETPLGLARTDRSYVDKLAALAGDHLFDDELAHRTEHSIEFQVVFLQYLLEGRRDYSIVPILVGSFHDLMQNGTDPIDNPEVRRFVEALRAAESASGQKVAYIGGIDLGHVGPEFGDPRLLDTATLEQLRVFDSAMLDHAAAGDASSWFAKATLVNNRWRICGLAATYTMLHAMGPARGKLLRYDQAVNPERTCCVSFASLVFDAHDHPDHAGTGIDHGR
jgi:AmmeMemoRadiSam system protein B